MKSIRIANIIAATLALAACDDPRAFKDALPFSSHYTASTSMEPTLPKGTRFTGYSVTPDELRRGDVLIIRSKQDEDHVSRLIGLPGDKVAVENGVVILNGIKVEQRRHGSWKVDDEIVGDTMDMFFEQLPGEAKPHRILDLGPTPGDDFAEIQLGPERYFLMGDNRDNAADSRFNMGRFGLGVVHASQIKRRVDMESIRD